MFTYYINLLFQNSEENSIFYDIGPLTAQCGSAQVWFMHAYNALLGYVSSPCWIVAPVQHISDTKHVLVDILQLNLGENCENVQIFCWTIPLIQL